MSFWAKKDKDLNDSYKYLFSSIEGKEVLNDIVAFCNILSPTFSKDVNEMLINEGKREVALMILSRLTLDVPDLQQIAKEINNGR